MNYCSHCGMPVRIGIPPGEHLPRHLCDACGTIHYQNPKLVVGCIAEWQGGILLCRRAIEPRMGWWTLPAGFMENAETTPQAAMRETLEEANARVEIDALFTLYNLPHINQVHLFFRARLLDLDFSPGTESLEVALFKEDGIPWKEMAFASVRETMKHWFDDRRAGKFGFHTGDIQPTPDQMTAFCNNGDTKPNFVA
jgi:ADP-ribose pyrophosphatase YjhB (NUDIX family)